MKITASSGSILDEIQHDLESYLPQGYKSKQLDKLIRLISTDFWPHLPEFARQELSAIAEKVKVL